MRISGSTKPWIKDTWRCQRHGMMRRETVGRLARLPNGLHTNDLGLRALEFRSAIFRVLNRLWSHLAHGQRSRGSVARRSQNAWRERWAAMAERSKVFGYMGGLSATDAGGQPLIERPSTAGLCRFRILDTEEQRHVEQGHATVFDTATDLEAVSGVHLERQAAAGLGTGATRRQMSLFVCVCIGGVGIDSAADRHAVNCRPISSALVGTRLGCRAHRRGHRVPRNALKNPPTRKGSVHVNLLQSFSSTASHMRRPLHDTTRRGAWVLQER